MHAAICILQLHDPTVSKYGEAIIYPQSILYVQVGTHAILWNKPHEIVDQLFCDQKP